MIRSVKSTIFILPDKNVPLRVDPRVMLSPLVDSIARSMLGLVGSVAAFHRIVDVDDCVANVVERRTDVLERRGYLLDRSPLQLQNLSILSLCVD